MFSCFKSLLRLRVLINTGISWILCWNFSCFIHSEFHHLKPTVNPRSRNVIHSIYIYINDDKLWNKNVIYCTDRYFWRVIIYG